MTVTMPARASALATTRSGWQRTKKLASHIAAAASATHPTTNATTRAGSCPSEAVTHIARSVG
jgi:hypothetical protein